MDHDETKRGASGSALGWPVARRTPLGQHLLDTRDPALGRQQRRLLLLVDGRRDVHVLGLILDELPIIEELTKMAAAGWVEWSVTPATLRRAA